VTDVAPAPSRLAPDTDEPVLIIGAGVAGPAVAARLGKMGIRAEILECGDGVAYVWRLRYDRMRMNTSGCGSAAFPRGRRPSRRVTSSSATWSPTSPSTT